MISDHYLSPCANNKSELTRLILGLLYKNGNLSFEELYERCYPFDNTQTSNGDDSTLDYSKDNTYDDHNKITCHNKITDMNIINVQDRVNDHNRIIMYTPAKLELRQMLNRLVDANIIYEFYTSSNMCTPYYMLSYTMSKFIKMCRENP